METELAALPEMRRRNASPARISVLLFSVGVFAALSLEVEIGGRGGFPWERGLTRAIVSHANTRVISDSSRMSHYVADPRGLALLVSGLTLIALVAGRFGSAVLLVSSMGIAALNLLLKPAYARPPPANVGGDLYSFPSGHAVGTMALSAAVVVILWRTWLRWPAVLVAAAFVAAIGAAVVAEEGHWPSDVLAGWALAIAWVAGLVLLAQILVARQTSPP